MWGTFGEYMYDLLAAPLRKVSQSANQFYVLFRVIGELFDATKQDIFRVREESMIITASEAMLELHGQDRDMQRLKGETVENYRTRLTMKYLLSVEAGTDAAVIAVAHAFGYDNVDIVPDANPQKWAEVNVQFTGGKIVLDDQALLLSELNKVKPAGALLHVVKEQRYTAQQYLGTATVIGKLITIRQG